ncbi:MAG: LON peptidase substrate-binding domain-containing protein [Acidimicrobiales bacterium]
MFPLGTVLLPSFPLELQVFEPRYQALVRHCLAGEREFGVVLIERGSEVGGDDVRTEVGTVAHITHAVERPGGRWTIGAVGVRRLRVLSWLADDPYPRAEVEDWPDAPLGQGSEATLERTIARLRQTLALAAEAGDAVAPATIALSEDVGLASHQAVGLAPVGPFDRHRLLGAPSPDARLEGLDALLVEAIEVLQLRLAEG